MKKVAKAILLALGIIFVIGAVVVLGVNLYVQSAGTRARIEHGLGAALHGTVKIGSVSFMPWYGVRISAITRDDAAASADGNSLEIADVSVRLRLWGLMNHDVVIKELTVDGVKVAWTQNSEGKWQMPLAAAATTVAPPPAQEEQPPAIQQPQPAPRSRPVTIDHARLRDSSFTFHDKNGKPIAALSGVYVEAPSPTGKLVQGNAAVMNVTIQREFYIENWRGRFKYTPEELSLFDTSCQVGGGEASGTLDVKVAEQDSPFALDTKFSGVDLARLLHDAGVTQLQASGMISGFVHLEGNSRDSSKAQGKGEIVLANGVIAEGALFESLDVLLQTDKFHSLNLQDAHADFHVGGGKIVLDDLMLKSPVLTFESKGVMATDGSALYLLCRLAISAGVVQQIPGSDFLLQNFTTDETTGARYVDFPISGDINHPDTSALLNTIGKHMSLKKGLGELWNAIGKKQAAPEPAPPQPTPPNP